MSGLHQGEDEAGDIVEQYSYDLHGKLNVRACGPSSASACAGVATPHDCNSTGAPPLPGDRASQCGNPLLYGGNHRDTVTGRYRMGARWYSLSRRMFLSRDPAGSAFSFD